MRGRRQLIAAFTPGICVSTIAGLASAASAAATVAPAAAPDPEEIVVTGERLTPAEARERAIAYVQHTGITHSKDSVARWIDPICPRAIGVAPEHARLVEARLRTIASEAGVPAAKPGCMSNITINFVGDGSTFARSVRRRAMAEVPLHLRPALINGTAPIRWWYSTEVRSREGNRMFAVEPPHIRTDGLGGQLGGMQGQQLQSNGETTTLTQYSSSVVSTQVARTLRSATVVIDTNRAEGATLDAIAAYAALVAFAEMKPRETPLPGSILGLFGSEPVPQTLTKLDMTFLRELYSLQLDRKARQQRGRLVRALQNEASKF